MSRYKTGGCLSACLRDIHELKTLAASGPYRAFWRKDQTNYYIEEFANILRKLLSEEKERQDPDSRFESLLFFISYADQKINNLMAGKEECLARQEKLKSFH